MVFPFVKRDLLAKFCALLVTSCGLLEGSILDGLCYETFANLSVGYRTDQVHSTSIAYESDDEPQSQTKLHFNDVPLVQGALLLGLTVSDSWILMADLSLGTVVNDQGRYMEEVITFGYDRNKSNVADGHSGDATLSLGYCPCFWSLFRLGPIGGWSYHSLTFNMPHVPMSFRQQSGEHSIRFKNHWQGPWVGVSGSTLLWAVSLYAEYEYHWPRWHATWMPVNGDVFATVFTDERKGTKGKGQVARFGATIPVYCSWSLGLEGKYQRWQVTKGSVKPRAGSFAAIGVPTIAYENLVEAHWQSWQGQIALYYDF